MPALFDIVNQLDEVVNSLPRGRWAPILWTPFSGAEERFMVALAIELGGIKKVLRIVDTLVLKAFYQSESLRALNIVDFIVSSLNTELISGKSITDLKSYTDSFAIGEARNIVAQDIDDAVIQVIQMYSSIMTKERYLEMTKTQKPQLNEDWTKSVKKICNNLMPNIGLFDRPIVVGERPISTFFTSESQKFVALSLQLTSDKQWSSLCSKARDANILMNSRSTRVKRAVTIIKKNDQAKELIERYQFEQSQMGQELLDCYLFNNFCEVPDFLKSQSILM